MSENNYPVTECSEYDRNSIKSLRNKYQGERCFIIGNGPSLNQIDLSKIKNEYSFGVNSIFLKYEDQSFVPSFYVVEDNHVIDDNIQKINSFLDKPKFSFFPAKYEEKIKRTKNTIFLTCDYGFYWNSHIFGGIPRFSRDASQTVFTGQSVTHINLQLAYYFGFDEVYLIGMDFNYIKPDSVIVEGNTWISTEDDPNHFDPSYFGKGKKWHDPKLDLVEINYKKSKQAYELSNKKIFNATVGGRLEVFQRKDFNSLF